MKKFSFITIMSYYPWGGSEELWQKTALHAAQNNIATEAHLFNPAIGHPKVKELSREKIKLHFRKQNPSLFDRIMRKMHLQHRNKKDPVNYWKNHFRQPADLYIISSGTTFDCSHYPELFDELHGQNLPYVYISQHHPEHGAINLPDIEKVSKVFRKAKKVFFVAQKNLKITQQQIAQDIINAEVVYNPINLKSKNYLQHTYTSDQTLRVACVARLECANKGQDILLRTLATEKWMNRDIHFSFYGQGPDEEYIKRLAQYLRLQHKVTFLGHVHDIRTVWETNHVLLMSSLAEGTPLSLMEAMACGRSAVLTDVGGNAEWITDGYNGFIAEAPVPASLDNALEKMWQQRDALPELGKRCYDTFLNKYPDDAITYFFDRLKILLPS